MCGVWYSEPGMGFDGLMPSLGPRGFLGSLWLPGSTHVPAFLQAQLRAPVDEC